MRVYRELEDAELVGIVDTNAERAAKIAAEFGTEVIPDLDALARNAWTPSASPCPRRARARSAVACSKLGIDVLVEKPMAASLEEADRLIASALRARTASCKSGTSSDSIPRSSPLRRSY